MTQGLQKCQLKQKKTICPSSSLDKRLSGPASRLPIRPSRAQHKKLLTHIHPVRQQCQGVQESAPDEISLLESGYG